MSLNPIGDWQLSFHIYMGAHRGRCRRYRPRGFKLFGLVGAVGYVCGWPSVPLICVKPFHPAPSRSLAKKQQP